MSRWQHQDNTSGQPLLLSNGTPVGPGIGNGGRRHARFCLFPFLPQFNFNSHKRVLSIYTSGALFAIGWWVFIDAIVAAAQRKAPLTHFGVEDYVPGICVTVGMIILNSVDRARLQHAERGYSRGIASTRIMLFLGVAMLAGGLAGSLSILTIKYLVPADIGDSLYYGLAVVIQSVAILISSIVLWFAQGEEEEFQYAFTL